MTSHNDTASRRRTPLPWLTLAAAAKRMEHATAGEVSTPDQLLQLCADGALTLTLRLEDSVGVKWKPAQDGWWYRERFRSSDPGTAIIELTGLFDVKLGVGGGDGLIDSIRWVALGNPPRGMSPSTLKDARIQIVGEDGTAYALLEPARYEPMQEGAKRFVPYVGGGVYAFASAFWPLSKHIRVEPVIRTRALDGWLMNVAPGATAPAVEIPLNNAPAASPTPVAGKKSTPTYVGGGSAALFQLARAEAQRIVAHYAARDLYPSQTAIADEVAADLRKRGMLGADGKPLTGSTIKRHALKGISSAAKKALSTTPKRGK